MSTIVERANAEADAVEAELGTEDPATDAVEEPDEPEAPPAAPVEEKAIKALGRVIDTYTAGLRRVMGDDFDALHECGYCQQVAPGFVLEEQSPLEQFAVDPDKQRCGKCNGYGQLRSGSLTEAALVTCMECTGNGWVAVYHPPPPAQGSPQFGVQQVPPGYIPATSEAQAVRDQWGRPLGHVHFGMDPASIGA